MPEPHDPGLSEVAAALAGLRPNPPVLDRDRLLFRAGRASAPRPGPWRLTAGVSTAVAAALAAVLLLRPAPAPVERVVFVRVEPPPPPAPRKDETPAPEVEPPAAPYASWPTTPYTRLEDRVLRWGLDGLAEPPPPTEPPQTLDALLKSL